jgi:two-component system sensor histidine kinase DegS
MGKKIQKLDINDQVLFVDSLISDYESRCEELLTEISEIKHTILQKDNEVSALKRGLSGNLDMFSPNTRSDALAYNSEWVEEIRELKRKKVSLEKKYKDYKGKLDRLKEIKELTPAAKSRTSSKNRDKGFAEPVQKDETMNPGAKLLEIQELERNRIASDLHDSAVQNLTGLVHKSELIIRLMDIDMIRARMEISQIIDVAKATIGEIRDAIFDLRTVSLDDLSLADAIDNFCNTINRSHNVAFMIYKEGDEYILEDMIQINLYRIAQEACTNIIKHSEATKASIHIEYGADTLKMTISDNGIGLPDKHEHKSKYARKHYGMLIMQERTAIMNGIFTATNKKDGGSEITVSVPVARGIYG